MVEFKIIMLVALMAALLFGMHLTAAPASDR
jgi:hypothetical protein